MALAASPSRPSVCLFSGGTFDTVGLSGYPDPGTANYKVTLITFTLQLFPKMYHRSCKLRPL